jgi:hypothetical protein
MPVDDPAVNIAFSEFLLQVQGCLPQPQSSRQTGLAVPRGIILMTLNEMETERYSLAFPYSLSELQCKKYFVVRKVIYLHVTNYNLTAALF